MVVVELRTTREERRHQGDSGAAADVAHEIEDAGGVAHLLLRDVGDGCGRERNEHASHGCALQNLRPENIPIAGVEIERRELPHGEGAEREAKSEEFARVVLAGQYADDWHGDQRTKST